jgi:hypothetical protein
MHQQQHGCGGQQGGRAASAAVAEWWRRQQHGVGSGTVAEAEAAEAQLTALPIPLLITAAQLGAVAVSLFGLRGGGRLLRGLSFLNVFYQYLLCCALVSWYITYGR